MVRIIAAELVQVAGQVVHLRVPHPVLVVDQADFHLRVGHLEKDVVFLCVVVAQNYWSVGDHLSQVGLVIIAEKGFTKMVHNSHYSTVACILNAELLAYCLHTLDALRAPFINGDFDRHL